MTLLEGGDIEENGTTPFSLILSSGYSNESYNIPLCPVFDVYRRPTNWC